VWIWLLACSGEPGTSNRTEPMSCTPPEPGASPPTASGDDLALAGIDFVLSCWVGWEPVTDVHLSFGEQVLSLDTGCQGMDAGYQIDVGVLSLLDSGTTDLDYECRRPLERQESWLLDFFQAEPVLTFEAPVLTLVGTDATLWFTEAGGSAQ